MDQTTAQALLPSVLLASVALFRHESHTAVTDWETVALCSSLGHCAFFLVSIVCCDSKQHLVLDLFNVRINNLPVEVMNTNSVVQICFPPFFNYQKPFSIVSGLSITI